MASPFDPTLPAPQPILGRFDQNGTYEHDDPEDLEPNERPSVVIDLFEESNEQGGSLKSSTKGGESDQLIVSQIRSGHSITVERLVWMDGFRGATGDSMDGSTEEPMTLVVLGLAFNTRRSRADNTIGFSEVELRFQSDKADGKDPKVIAWGPFRHEKKWNFSTSQNTNSSNAEASISADVAGQGLGFKGSRGKQKSWEQVDFDRGSSRKEFGPRGYANGVLWQLRENQHYKDGISPEIRLAVLISRQLSTAPCRATLRIATHIGSLDAIWDKGQKFLGMRGGKDVEWRWTPNPGSKDLCFDEGRRIVEPIDANNLGKLLDGNDITDLGYDWLQTYRSDHPQSEAAVRSLAQQDSAGNIEVTSVAAKAVAGSDRGQPPHPQRSIARRFAKSLISENELQNQSSQTLEGKNPPRSSSVVSALDDDYGGYSRLVALEARMAHAESRLLDQGDLIFTLRQEVARLAQLVARDPSA
ncbi:hypothetical protein BJ166DRAFT_522195 [Pestalotiopsis sp. NC0098]|nr:hypothetical protein BJ166DRAFT_522195 [Pestalotiopsis sp. NC0098]